MIPIFPEKQTRAQQGYVSCTCSYSSPICLLCLSTLYYKPSRGESLLRVTPCAQKRFWHTTGILHIFVECPELQNWDLNPGISSYRACVLSFMLCCLYSTLVQGVDSCFLLSHQFLPFWTVTWAPHLKTFSYLAEHYHVSWLSLIRDSFPSPQNKLWMG